MNANTGPGPSEHHLWPHPSSTHTVITGFRIQGTSMTSVWPCLVQKAWGGVVQLTDTKLLGLRSTVGVRRLLQAGEDTSEVT